MKIQALLRGEPRFFSVPLYQIVGFGLPVLLTFVFYISYSYRAWFFQDDFQFLVDFATSGGLGDLLGVGSFGRFVSRNLYWFLGTTVFGRNSELYFLFNFLLILTICAALYRIFSRFGRFAALIASSLYFLSPATIESYGWISNSQHILGHLFVVAFVLVFMETGEEDSKASRLWRFLLLMVIVPLGFASNIFFAMVLSLPAWMILVDPFHRRLASNYVVLVFGAALFVLFYVQLSGAQTGAYSTSYDFVTLRGTLAYYFRGDFNAFVWLAAICAGVFVSLKRGNLFTAWLFLASAAFFLPFAFFIHQRHVQYGNMTYLFFLLGVWSLLLELYGQKTAEVMKWVGVGLAFFVFLTSLDGALRFYTKYPYGAIQREQVEFLRQYNAEHPDVRNYCFRAADKVENPTGVAAWDIPRDWWFLGFGVGLKLFVDPEKSYVLVQDSPQCDVVMVFENEKLHAE